MDMHRRCKCVNELRVFLWFVWDYFLSFAPLSSLYRPSALCPSSFWTFFLSAPFAPPPSPLKFVFSDLVPFFLLRFRPSSCFPIALPFSHCFDPSLLRMVRRRDNITYLIRIGTLHLSIYPFVKHRLLHAGSHARTMYIHTYIHFLLHPATPNHASNHMPSPTDRLTNPHSFYIRLQTPDCSCISVLLFTTFHRFLSSINEFFSLFF